MICGDFIILKITFYKYLIIFLEFFKDYFARPPAPKFDLKLKIAFSFFFENTWNKSFFFWFMFS